MNIKYVIISIILLLIILILYRYKENNSGALIQLAAKGPQDYYLTGMDSLYPYYYYPYYYPYYSRFYYPLIRSKSHF